MAVDVSTIVLLLGGLPGPVIHLCRDRVAAQATGTSTGIAQLTRREQQVLRALCRGYSTDAISTEMGVSETTVRNHVQHLLAKLAAHSRAEAVAVAFREGLII